MNAQGNGIRQALSKPENLKTLISVVGILVAVVLALVGICSKDLLLIFGATAFIAGVTAGLQIMTSHKAVERDENTKEILSLLQKARISATPPLRFRKELEPLEVHAQSAEDILIIGRTLSVVGGHPEFFKERLAQGARIRLALVDEENEHVRAAIGPAGDRLIADLRRTREVVNEIKTESCGRGTLEVRLIEYVPTLSFLLVGDDSVLIELVPYRVGPDKRPSQCFKKEESFSWFAYFRQVAERVWEDAKLVDLAEM